MVELISKTYSELQWGIKPSVWALDFHDEWGPAAAEITHFCYEHNPLLVYDSRVPKFEQILLQSKKKQQEDQVSRVAEICRKLDEALRRWSAFCRWNKSDS